MNKIKLINQVCVEDSEMIHFDKSIDFWKGFSIRIQNAYFVQSIYEWNMENKEQSNNYLASIIINLDSDSKRFKLIVDIFKKANNILKELNIEYVFKNEENPFNGELSRKIVTKLLCASCF